MSRYVLALDQGTTQSTALVVGDDGAVLGKASEEFPQIYPRAGWVEHNPEDIWASLKRAIAKALDLAGLEGTDITAIGVTNQRETTALWNNRTGDPLMNAIVWQCRRTAEICAQLKADGHEEFVKKKTGLLLDPYFSGTKLKWMFDHFNQLGIDVPMSDICFGTIDSFVVWRLSGGVEHVTDLSNASRTLLCDIETGAWDDDLLKIFEVPREILPRIVSSSEQVGVTRDVTVLPDGIPITGIAGDQQAALFGQACFEVGDCKCTYGTGGFMMMNVGEAPIHSKSGLLSTVAWSLNGNITYALEGSVFVAGAAVQWLRDGLGLIERAEDIEELASMVENSGGVVFVPALAGLGAPHWRADARGTIVGITRGTTKAHLARATLEGIALQIAELANSMEVDCGSSLESMRVDGGASDNDLLMQIQADLMATRIIRPRVLETTALGAGFLAGLAAGVWQSKDQIRDTWQEECEFVPQLGQSSRKRTFAAWKEALQKV